MLHLLRKRTWFPVLLIFLVSCSLVSVASAQSFHNGMMGQVDVTEIHHAQMSVKIHDGRMTDCHDAAQVEKHLSPVMVKQHTSDCHDCQLWHCQMTIGDVQTINPDLVLLVMQANATHKSALYQANVLVGYWQQLLRPPKI